MNDNEWVSVGVIQRDYFRGFRGYDLCMDDELKIIVSRMVDDLKPWLEKPSATSEKIARLREDAAALQSELGPGILGDLTKQLQQAESEAQRARKRQAANAISEICRGLGIVLEAKDPLKRAPRKKKAQT